MRNYFVLTGFLIGLAIGVILVGRQITVAYETSLTAQLEAKILAIKAAEAEALKNFEENKTVHVALSGDIMLSRAVGKKMEITNDFTFPFLKIYGALNGNDIVFGNLEGPISSNGKNQGSKYSFRADPRVVSGLVFSGFNVLSLANNHIWDYGQSALLDTLDILTKNNILVVGVGENYDRANEIVIKEVKGVKIGFLAYTDLYPQSFRAGKNYAGISDFNLEKIIKEISSAKASSTADLIFVSLHWGDEYVSQPNETQKNIAQKLVEAGADVIVGHHPHVVQSFEGYKTGLIFYSLGNFIFDQNFSEETMSGFLVKLTVKDKKIVDWKVFNTRINNDFQVEPEDLSSGQKTLN